MTPIGTDQRIKEGKKSVSICEIGFALRLSVALLERGLKQTGLREKKALAGFEADGHSGSYIQSLVTIATPSSADLRPLRLRLHSM